MLSIVIKKAADVPLMGYIALTRAGQEKLPSRGCFLLKDEDATVIFSRTIISGVLAAVHSAKQACGTSAYGDQIISTARTIINRLFLLFLLQYSLVFNL